MIEELNIVKTGSLSIEAGENHNKSFNKIKWRFKKIGDSSVIHIKYKGKNYLVDTGFAGEWNLSPENISLNRISLMYYLAFLGLSFESIAGIFITHWHHDHFGNLPLFNKARLYIYEPSREMAIKMLAKKCGFTHLFPPVYLNETDTFAGCTLFPTPGHTITHCSLIALYENFTFCIAGDAIVSQSYYDKDEVWSYNSGNMGKEKCIKAMKDITSKSDYIIPGHGHLFQNYKEYK